MGGTHCEWRGMGNRELSASSASSARCFFRLQITDYRLQVVSYNIIQIYIIYSYIIYICIFFLSLFPLNLWDVVWMDFFCFGGLHWLHWLIF